MKMKIATFDEEGDLETITVTMGARELGLIYQVFGHISPQAIMDAFYSPWALMSSVLEDICESGSIINTFYENGVEDIVRQHKELKLTWRES